MRTMSSLFQAAALGGLALLPAPVICAQSALVRSASSDVASGSLTDIPPAPKGQSTIFGGAIRDFDPVRDRFTLDVVGQRPMRVLVDPRTQVFRDGTKIRLSDLGPAEHASVETTLDGADVFALSIHILSQLPEGQYEGKVVSFDRSSGALSIRANSSRDPLQMFVGINTQFLRKGQRQFTSVGSGPADLQPGSLVSVTFQSRSAGHAEAKAITVLAVPGSSFVFEGNLVSIDLHSGLLIVVDPTDQKDYQILFNAALFPESRALHAGDRIRVRAAYNGTNFIANEMAAN